MDSINIVHFFRIYKNVKERRKLKNLLDFKDTKVEMEAHFSNKNTISKIQPEYRYYITFFTYIL